MSHPKDNMTATFKVNIGGIPVDADKLTLDQIQQRLDWINRKLKSMFDFMTELKEEKRKLSEIYYKDWRK